MGLLGTYELFNTIQIYQNKEYIHMEYMGKNFACSNCSTISERYNLKKIIVNDIIFELCSDACVKDFHDYKRSSKSSGTKI